MSLHKIILHMYYENYVIDQFAKRELYTFAIYHQIYSLSLEF